MFTAPSIPIATIRSDSEQQHHTDAAEKFGPAHGRRRDEFVRSSTAHSGLRLLRLAQLRPRSKPPSTRSRAQGVSDFRRYLAEHPDFTRQAVGLVRVLDVNDAAVELFGAGTKEELLVSLHRLFLPETEAVFARELIALAEGKPHSRRRQYCGHCGASGSTSCLQSPSRPSPPPWTACWSASSTSPNAGGRKRRSTRAGRPRARQPRLDARGARGLDCSRSQPADRRRRHQCRRRVAFAQCSRRTSRKFSRRSTGSSTTASAREKSSGGFAPWSESARPEAAARHQPGNSRGGRPDAQRSAEKRHYAADATAAGLPPVLGDRIQLQQVVLNLILNAVEATSGVDQYRRELVVITADEGERCASRSAIPGSTHGQRRSTVSAVLYDQGVWHGHGIVDLPVDHRSAWRAMWPRATSMQARPFSSPCRCSKRGSRDQGLGDARDRSRR